MVLDVRPFRNPNNIDILNAIRKNATVDYQKRIPEATKANIQDTINSLLNYRPQMNEFIDALVNRIGLEIVKNTIWTNPLAKFKRGMLEYGDTIEEIMVGLLKAKRYDTDREYLEKDIFGQERPDVQSSFHKVNRQDFYKISINEAILKRAFLNDYGISSFITSLMTAPTTSDNWDEFLLTTSLFKEYYDANGFFKVNVPDLGAASSDGADARYGLRRMRELADNLTFVSTHYNASGMPIAATRDELELFITPEANAAMDVEALAAAFNIDKAQFDSRKTVIPAEHMNIDGAQAILTTRDFFVIADQRIDTTNAINPVGLHTNYFLHHWEVISASRFVPAILFTTEESTPINIIDTPVTGITEIIVYDADGDDVTTDGAERGGLFEVDASAVTEGDNIAVRFEIEGALSPRTYITQTGTLHIALDEDATSITIKVIAVDDNAFVDSITLDIIGDKVDLWPNPGVLTDDDLDGILEVTPKTLTLTEAGNVKIPNQEGVSWAKRIDTGVTFTDTGDIVTVPGHNASVGDVIVFGTITSTTGVTAGTEYYVLTTPTEDTMTISATEGGSTLALTTNGSAASASFPKANNVLVPIDEGQTVTFVATLLTGYELADGAELEQEITRD